LGVRGESRRPKNNFGNRGMRRLPRQEGVMHLKPIVVKQGSEAPYGSQIRRFPGATYRLAGGAIMVGLLACMLVPVSAQGTCTKMFPVRVQEWTGNIINIVPWVAADEGFFQKHCVNVRFVPLSSGPGSLAALPSGSINFANGAMDKVMLARARNFDLQLTGNMYAAPWVALVARKGLDLSRANEGWKGVMHDLVGKKIGVTVLGGSVEAYVRTLFEGAGLSPTSATYVAVGGFNTTVPALKNNVVDVAEITAEPELGVALGAGRIIVDLRERDVGPPVLQALWGATLSWAAYGPWIRDHPEAVADFTIANNDAIKWIQNPDNREKLYAIVKRHMPLPATMPDPEATLKAIVDANARGLDIGIPESSVDGWNNYIISLKEMDKPIPYDELVWKTGRR
jgi:NitT/TauT family transport system substrate-binding protein